MPNGGSDCCGTCPFNTRNKGEAGYDHANDPDPPLCRIRGDMLINNPFWTYCANHPHHNPEGIDIPIGPVYAGDEFRRWVISESPDTPELREKLLLLIEKLPVTPAWDYPFGASLRESVILQLGEWAEPRALPALRRIVAAAEREPDQEELEPEMAFVRTASELADAARGAIDRIRAAGHTDPPTN